MIQYETEANSGCLRFGHVDRSGKEAAAAKHSFRQGSEPDRKERNYEALEENPELVNKDPYGEGWLIKVKPEDIKAVEDLLDAEAYKAVVNG